MKVKLLGLQQQKLVWEQSTRGATSWEEGIRYPFNPKSVL